MSQKFVVHHTKSSPIGYEESVTKKVSAFLKSHENRVLIEEASDEVFSPVTLQAFEDAFEELRKQCGSCEVVVMSQHQYVDFLSWPKTQAFEKLTDPKCLRKAVVAKIWGIPVVLKPIPEDRIVFLGPGKTYLVKKVTHTWVKGMK